MSTTQPEALRLADWLEDQVVIYQQFSEGEPGGYAQEVDQVMDEAAAELRRQHADLAHADRYAEQLGRELSKAGAENADLRARVQELGQMARDVNSRRVVELEAQLASISPPEGMAGWMPIETAPKNKTNVILLRQACGSVANGFWLAEAYAGNGSWIWPYVHKNPTHWMPAPPIASEAKGASHADQA
jgi:hypothetical protein